MILARVEGTVVATRKDEGLEGFKLLVVRQVTPTLEESKSFLVTVDTVGAGVGEIVIVVGGSSARMTPVTKNLPVDSAIIAIVDTIECQGDVVYRKTERKQP